MKKFFVIFSFFSFALSVLFPLFSRFPHFHFFLWYVLCTPKIIMQVYVLQRTRTRLHIVLDFQFQFKFRELFATTLNCFEIELVFVINFFCLFFSVVRAKCVHCLGIYVNGNQYFMKLIDRLNDLRLSSVIQLFIYLLFINI